MAFLNPSNQLIQIDTGNALTYLFNPNTSPISIYAGIGETQVLGQRYFSQTNTSAANPYGSPTIYMLVKYSSTGQPAPVAGPAPVYWTDNTFTTVSGVESEAGLLGINGVAGYLMPNTTSISGLTAAMLQGAQCLIAVAGLVLAAYAPTTTPGAGYLITGSAGNWTSTGTAGGTAPPARPLGLQLTAAASGLANVLVLSDII